MTVRPASRRRQHPLPFPGTLRCDGAVDATDDPITAALDEVGPRLRRVRAQRGATLAEVSASTGISTSTLSRLENGQRRASLELLLPLAAAYGVPLDDLVGAPEVADPRVRLKAYTKSGRTVIPLTRQPGGVQAWKIIIPPTNTKPVLKTHEGHEWLYVLSGRMRLIIGDRDWVVREGEVVEFDTRLPHWFGSAGKQPAEILSMFGPQGERVHAGHAHGRRGD